MGKLVTLRADVLLFYLWVGFLPREVFEGLRAKNGCVFISTPCKVGTALREVLGSWLMSAVTIVLTKNTETKCPDGQGWGGKVGLTLPLWKAAGFWAVQTSLSPGTHRGRACGGVGGPSSWTTAWRELPLPQLLG